MNPYCSSWNKWVSMKLKNLQGWTRDVRCQDPSHCLRNVCSLDIRMTKGNSLSLSSFSHFICLYRLENKGKRWVIWPLLSLLFWLMFNVFFINSRCNFKGISIKFNNTSAFDLSISYLFYLLLYYLEATYLSQWGNLFITNTNVILQIQSIL